MSRLDIQKRVRFEEEGVKGMDLDIESFGGGLEEGGLT